MYPGSGIMGPDQRAATRDQGLRRAPERRISGAFVMRGTIGTVTAGRTPLLPRRDYVISTITIEWSEIPASRARCEYRQDEVRGISEGVANT